MFLLGVSVDIRFTFLMLGPRDLAKDCRAGRAYFGSQCKDVVHPGREGVAVGA